MLITPHPFDAQMMTNAEKLATRPISELDVSAWPRCSTSYVQLPKDYPSFKCTGRTPEQASILNDIWVSVTSGSEDYSFKVHSVGPKPCVLLCKGQHVAHNAACLVGRMVDGMVSA